MKSRTCCFTGHRIIPANEYKLLKTRVEKAVLTLVGQGIVYFGVGGATGFDTLAAQTVLKLKRNIPQIFLILVLPCENQTRFWREEDKKQYNHILKNSDKVVYMSGNYYKGCMQLRNRHLVENSSVCLCYLTQNKGGTAYTVNYAQKRGVKVINLA